MTDEPGGTGSASPDQWRDVMKGFDEFGDAIARWVRASVNDPKNRERAEDLKTHVTSVADKVSDAVSDATKTDAGQSVRNAANQAGDAVKQAGSRFTSEVAPSLADMFRSAAAGISEAASRMESRAEAVDVAEPAGEEVPDEEAPAEEAPADTADAAGADEPTAE